MCEPTMAFAAISTVATLAGSVMSAQGQMQQGQAAQQASTYQQAAAENNRRAADRNAAEARRAATEAEEAGNDAIDRGRFEEADFRGRVRQLTGRQRAVLAANGVLVDSGTGLDILGDTVATGERDALQIRSNAEREALQYRQRARGLRTDAENFRTQSANFQNEASLAYMSGQNAMTAASTRARSTLFDGVSSVASTWYNVGDAKGWFEDA